MQNMYLSLCLYVPIVTRPSSLAEVKKSNSCPTCRFDELPSEKKHFDDVARPWTCFTRELDIFLGKTIGKP